MCLQGVSACSITSCRDSLISHTCDQASAKRADDPRASAAECLYPCFLLLKCTCFCHFFILLISVFVQMSSTNRVHSQPIFRVRTGCFTCRGRKKKCDETKPRCRGCERNQLSCRWPWSVRANNTTKPSPRSVLPTQPGRDCGHIRVPSTTGFNANTTTVFGCSLPALGSAGRSPPSVDYVPCDNPSGSEAQVCCNEPVSIGNPEGSSASFFEQLEAITFPYSLPDSPTTLACLPETYTDDHNDEESTATSLLPRQVVSGLVSGNIGERIPSGLGILPGIGGTDSPDLLRHYLGVTTLSMSNGSTPWNPFLVQLVPLAFGSKLVLQLILTQSAVHRAVRLLDGNDTVAYRYYDRSLQLLQREISNAAGTGGREDALTLGIGALIMCFIEVSLFGHNNHHLRSLYI